MLTSMFYYNHYKPYIFKTEQRQRLKERIKPDFRENIDNVANGVGQFKDDKKLLLNKALNKDVVNYAQNVSYNLVDLKDSVKYINYDINDFEHNSERYGYEETKDTIKDNISNFVEQFNKSYNFYSSQGHSQSLVDFSVQMNNTITVNESNLVYLGILKNEEGTLEFDDSVYNALSQDELKGYINEAKTAFHDLYNSSTDMLAHPLAEHMNFKSLNYYYNYKYGGVVADTFKVIESGMMVDIAI